MHDIINIITNKEMSELKYVLVSKGRKGLKVGRKVYSKAEAENKLSNLKALGNSNLQIMSYDDVFCTK